ncbi:MAG: polysaccharide biosynthesis C-terminal domain-containing protein, partial [Candidatus Omnitrophica bacterium]|nr:polysaccharide biosynthesis C-terminal domain-containing protein [Candidatus Omnitrophota bacterium]
VGEGGVAVLYFAYRLILFPLGIFGNSLSQVILPTFSTQALEDNYEKLRQTFSFGLRAIFFVMLPASIGFMVLAYPIISTLFKGGRFDTYSVLLTASALRFYSIGLFAYGSTKILQSCFFALKDTFTPTKVAFLNLILNIILNISLIIPLKLAGLALATSISSIITTLILFSILSKRLGFVHTKLIFLSFMRILCASICMGLVCYFISQRGIFLGSYGLAKVLNLAIMIISSLISYVIFCFVFKVEEVREIWQWVSKKGLALSLNRLDR